MKFVWERGQNVGFFFFGTKRAFAYFGLFLDEVMSSIQLTLLGQKTKVVESQRQSSGHEYYLMF